MATGGLILKSAVFAQILVLVISVPPEYRFYFGRAQGVDKTDPSNNVNYFAYYGIPFADPPVGDLRFKAPVRYHNVGGPNAILTTDKVRTACYQPVFRSNFKMSEDCLYLNVYAPSEIATTGAKKAVHKVMVWIHGGGFVTGNSYIYTPSRLVTERDVIVVTFNYRLGVFGFMSSGGGDGNYGLMDQIAALEWVRENIGTFGGDPQDVTLFGESAGAISASVLSLSPHAKGLFNRVILQSGNALSPGYLKSDPASQFDKLAKKTGCSPWFYSSWLRKGFTASITNCLRRLPASQLQGSALSLVPYSSEPVYGDISDANDASFSPVVDGKIITRPPNMLMSDVDYLRETGTLDKSYLMGFNNNEGLLFAELFFGSGGTPASIQNITNAEAHLDNVLGDKFRFGVPAPFKAVATYEYLYPRVGGNPPLQSVLNIAMDYSFMIPTVKMARTLSINNSPVYLYLFDHNPRVTNFTSGITGASHAMELAYLFDADPWLAQYNYYTTVPDPNGSDQALFGVLQGAWSQFAVAGSPAGYSGTTVSSPWPRYDVTSESYLSISTSPQVKQSVYPKRVALWTEMFMSRPQSQARSFGSLYG